MEPHIINVDFPEFIETERLSIRSPLPGDGAEFYNATLETLEELQIWLGVYRDRPPTVALTEALMREKYAEFITRRNMMLACFLKGTKTFVVSINLRPDWMVPRFEIGYWCRKSYQRQGYVTEAVNAITDFAFNHLNAKRVFICCDTDNVASIKVARRAGFELEGTLRNDDRKHDGTLGSTFVFSQIRPD